MDEIVAVLCPLKVQLVSVHVHTAVCVYMVFIAHLLYTCIYLLPISVMFIHYLLPTTRHTGSLECFHNVMLGYATKRISYRCMLCTSTCKQIVIETKERDSKSIHVCNVLCTSYTCTYNVYPQNSSARPKELGKQYLDLSSYRSMCL